MRSMHRCAISSNRSVPWPIEAVAGCDRPAESMLPEGVFGGRGGFELSVPDAARIGSEEQRDGGVEPQDVGPNLLILVVFAHVPLAMRKGFEPAREPLSWR